MFRRVVTVLLSALLAVAGVQFALGPGPAAASVVRPFALDYDKVVYGDFLEIGNGNMRCPTAAEGALGSGSPATCAAGQLQGSSPAQGNNSFYMLNADVDNDPGTFNSSTSAITIPPGATVDFARLNWGGDTGRFKGADGKFGATPACTTAGLIKPPNPPQPITPPGSPATQRVRLTVAGSSSVDVAPDVYTADGSAALNSQEEYYSAYADVTPDFQSAARASAVNVTVGNIWTATGINCYAGWSLIVVYKYPQRTPTYAPSKREVFVYDGHVRQGATDAPTTTTVTGFRAAAANAKIGVTAYEGDRQISGDQFKVNGTAIDPVGDGTPTNFFVSNADGVVNPSAFNNYSVDAKTFQTSLIPLGSTSATLTFSTSGDGYVAQNFALSLPVPELDITKTANPTTAHAGDPITYTITVDNPSTATATGVVVDDPLVPNCSRPIGRLTATQPPITYTCTGIAPADDITNTATVTGKSDLGDDLSGSAQATVDVIHPKVSITKTADDVAYRAGDTVTFTIKVTNSGDVPLTGTAVTDAVTPSCARSIGALAVGASSTYTCTTTAPVTGNRNTADVSGTDPLGLVVRDSATAAVPVIAPGIAITKSAAPSTVRAGETVTYTIAVTNTGDSPLSPVSISDAQTPACARTLAGSLAAGATVTYTCTDAPGASVVNTATATGTDLSGQQVTDSASAAVTVIRPALSLTKSADPGPYVAGDTIDYGFRLVNTGDVPLIDVAVDDPTNASCDRSFATLAAGATETWTCTAIAGSADVSNTATASGTDPAGRPVTDTSTVRVQVVHPRIDIAKTAAPDVVVAGETVTYTITVRNSGDATLTAVAVTDANTPACNRTIGTLAAGATTSYTCTQVAGSTDITNTATVTGTPPAGPPVSDTDTATVDVTHPSLEIVKTASPTIARVGQPITYSIVVRNTGDVTLTDVRVDDPIVPGCDNTVDSLAAGDIRSSNCLSTATDDVTNTATVTGTPPAGPAVRDSDSASVNVIHPAITIAKSVAPTQAREGDPVTYTITVTNTGDVPLTDVAVTDPLVPACATTVGTLAVGASAAAITCDGVAPSDDLHNTATATGTPPDGSPVTDSAGADLDVIHPAVTITKSANPATVRAGDTVIYSITVHNTGDVPLTSLAVADVSTPACARALAPLDAAGSVTFTCSTTAGDSDFANTAIVTGTDPTGQAVTDSDTAQVDVVHPAITISKSVDPADAQAGQPVTYTIVVTNSGDVALTGVSVSDPLVTTCAGPVGDGVLQPGQSETRTCPFTAPTDGFTNTATATGQPEIGGPVRDTASAQLVIDHPAIEITKVADVAQARVGDAITFTITVHNSGDVPLRTVVVDPSFTECGRRIPALDVAQTVTYTCVVTAPDDDVTNTVIATGTPPSGPAVKGTADATVDVIHPAVSITKTGPTEPVRVGDPITFTIAVRNTGDVALTDVKVADPVTPGCAQTIGDLPVLGSATYTCTTTAPADDFTNTATVSGTDPTERPVTDVAQAAVDVIHPDLTIEKSVTPTTARPGDPLLYSISVTNSGDVPLTGVTVNDPLVPACDDAIGSLAVGATVTYTCPGSAPEDDLENTATVTGTPPVGGPVSASDTAAVDVQHPSIAITKTYTGGPVGAGATVTFSISVTNTGDVALTDVVISDPLAPDCNDTIADLAVGRSVQRSCTMTALAADFTNTASVIGTPPVGPPVTDIANQPVSVIHPALTITKTGPSTPVRAGASVQFTITVTNTGDTPLSSVTVTDASAAACDRTIGDLAVGARATYTCDTKAGDRSFTNVADVVGTDSAGGQAVATDTAAVTVVHPAISITKTADVRAASPGQTITYTIVVRNVGDVVLRAVHVSDPSAPACTRDLADLAPGGVTTFRCTLAAPSATYVNRASVQANPVGCTSPSTPPAQCAPVPGGPVSAAASVTVTITPAVESGILPETVHAAGGLASTGVPVGELLAVAGGMVGLGLLLLLVTRRRRSA